ncbi:MAG: VTT domain-containing protein [Flavobacteriales bacterium]|nr:VTT domain-containing protein [Flavobacteriales bacterium]MCB9192236.1 VTT domain-containing protein [Flavobacteriales bacterium]
MSKKSLIRLIVLLTVSLILMYVGRHSGFSRYFGLDYLTNTIKNTGMFGIVIFGVVYIIGTLMNIPGMIFLFVLFLVYDGIGGFFIGYASTLLAMMAHFYFTRCVAGEVLKEIKHPLVKKYSDRLTEKPLSTTIILRLILFISPPVNYALAFSSIRSKEFILGSMIAMPVNLTLNYLLTIYAKDWMLNLMG